MNKTVRIFAGVWMLLMTAGAFAPLQAQINAGDYEADGNNKKSFLGGRQAPNFDFEGDWQDVEPWGWNSSASFDAGHSASQFKKNQSIWQSSPRTGSQGSTSMKIQVTQSQWYHYSVPFGTTSKEQMGTLTTGKLYYYDDKENGDSYIIDASGDGDAEFRWSFTQRPDSIVFWAWSQASKSGKSNVTLYLHNKSSFKDLAGKGGTSVSYKAPNGTTYSGSYSGGTLIGCVIFDIPNTGGWVRYSLPIDYKGTTANPAMLLLSFTAGPSFRSVQEGDILYVDDIMFVYNNQTNLRSSSNFTLSSIDKGPNGRYVCNSTDPCPITINYTLSGTMSPFNKTGGNEVIARLSDKDGSFARPRNLGSVKSNRSGSFSVNIPTDVPSSLNYKIRLVSTDYPDTTGAIALQIIRQWKMTTHIAKINADGSITEDGKEYGRVTPQYYYDRWDGGRVSSADGYHQDSNRLELTADDSHIPHTLFVGWYAGGKYVGTDKTLFVDVTSDTNIYAVFDTLYTLTCRQAPGTREAIFHLDDIRTDPPTQLSSLTVRRSVDTTVRIHFSLPVGFGFHGFLFNEDTLCVSDPAMTPFYNNIPDNYLYTMKVDRGGVIRPLIDTLVYSHGFKVAASDNLNAAYDKLGYITGASDKYKHFDTLRVTAHPVNDYSIFDGWYDSASGNLITKDTLLKVFVSGPAVYVAAFKEEMHTVSVSVDSAEWGSVQLYVNNHAASSPQTVSGVDENIVRVTATARKGYAFQYWKVRKVYPSYRGLAEVNTTWAVADTVFVAEHADADYTLAAVFDTSRHSLRLTKTGMYENHNPGTVSGAAEHTGGKTGYKYGEKVMLTATADSGYYFVKWDIPGQPDSVCRRDTQWVQIFSDTVFNAVFEIKKYPVTVTWNNDNLGYVTPNTGSYNHFQVLHFVAKPTPVGEMRYWLVNGDTVSTQSDYSLTVTDTLCVHALFSYRRCKVTISGEPEANGIETVNGENPTGEPWIFEWGSRVEFNAYVVDSGYRFVGWRTPGGDTIADAHFVIDSITTDTVLVAMFPPKLYTVSVRQRNQNRGDAYVGDTVLHQRDSSVDYMQEVKLYAVPKTGYEFQGWYNNAATSEADALCMSTDNPATLKVRKDSTVYAWFRDLRYEINLTAVPKTGGVLRGAGMYIKPKKVDSSAIVTIEAVANPGYDFMGWYEDTLHRWSDSKKSFPLEKGLFLIARFKERTDTLRLAALPDTAVYTLTGAGAYLQDYNARLYASVKEGYELTGWYNAEEELLSELNPYLHGFKGGETVTARLQHKALAVDFTIEPPMCGHVDMPVCRYAETTTAVAQPQYGYRFVCWKYTDGDTIKTESGLPVGAELSILSTVDTAFTAVFAPLYYGVKINYDTAGGEVSGNDSLYAYTAYAPLMARAKPHHTFLGWYTPAGTLLSADTLLRLMVTADTEVEARFDRTPTFSMVKIEPPVAGYILNKGERIGDTLYHGCGEPLFLEAEPFDGYEFSGWRIEKKDQVETVWFSPRGLSLQDSSYVTAVFDTLQYFIEVRTDSERGGVVGAGTVKHGQDVRLSAVPAVGYVFTAYKEAESGRVMSYEPVYTFRADSSIELEAVFDIARFRLAVTSADTGAVLFGSGLYSVGDTMLLSAWNLDPLQNFAFWSKHRDGRDTLSRTTPYRYVLEAPADDTVYAFYTRAGLKLTLFTNNSQYGTVKGAGNYIAGSTAVVEALPRYGYHLESWNENGFPVSCSDTLYLEMASDRTLEAVFKPDRITIGLKAVTEDGVEVAEVEMHGDGQYDYGQEIFIEINKVPFGYRFVKWRTEDGNTLSENTAYSRIMQTGSVIYAVLAKQQFDIKGKVTGDGTVTGAGMYAKGASAVLEALPADNWKFVYWRMDGKFYSLNQRIEVEAYRDMEVEAVFAWDAATAQPNIGMEGGGNVYALVSKGADDRVVLRAVPNPGYDFLYWTYDGDSIISYDRDCEILVEKSSLLTAHFQRSIYQVRFKMVGETDGVVSVSGTGSYRYNEQVELKVELRDGYSFDGWYRNVEGGFVFVSDQTEFSFGITESMSLEVKVSKK